MVMSVCGSAELGVVIWSLIGVFVVWCLIWCLIQWSDTVWLYRESKWKADRWQKESDKWQKEWSRVCLERDEYKAENDRLKKAASKLVMHVAQDFGKDVANPKAYE